MRCVCVVCCFVLFVFSSSHSSCRCSLMSAEAKIFFFLREVVIHNAAKPPSVSPGYFEENIPSYIGGTIARRSRRQLTREAYLPAHPETQPISAKSAINNARASAMIGAQSVDRTEKQARMGLERG